MEPTEFTKCKNDIVYFAKKYCRVNNEPIIIYKYQEKLLRAIQYAIQNDHTLMLSGSRYGKRLCLNIYKNWNKKYS